MKKEEIYVVIDSEEKRLRAIQILTDAGESVFSGSELFKEFPTNENLEFYDDIEWLLSDNFDEDILNKNEITLDQLEQMLTPKQEIKMPLDALKLIAESWGFELVEKKREIKVGDFGKFWSDNNCYFVGFLQDVYKISETNKCVFQMKDYGTFCYFSYLTEEEKANIQENW
jgi:hypothetical protein